MRFYERILNTFLFKLNISTTLIKIQTHTSKTAVSVNYMSIPRQHCVVTVLEDIKNNKHKL